MPVDPNQFAELTNALQHAFGLVGKRVTDARAEVGDADELYAAIARAVEAARRLRPSGDEPGGAR